MAQINRTRAEQAANLQRWADLVEPEDLTDADPEDSRQILELLDEYAGLKGFETDAPEIADRPGHRSTKSTGY